MASEVWREISKYSKKLYEKGYMSSHSGNLSIRCGDKIYIKRRGACCDEIGPDDVIEADFEGNDSSIFMGSSETDVHRQIYKATSALAVVHTHAPYSIVCSQIYDEILPADTEGEYLLHKIPVIIVDKLSGSKESANKMSEALKSYKGVVMRAHGTFATGKVMEEAFHVTCMMENTCFVRYLADQSGMKLKRTHDAEYKNW